MKPVAVTGALALLLVAAACGKAGARIYTRAATSACLTKAGFAPTPVATNVDFVATSATGGAFTVRLTDNRVTVSFGATQADADNIDDAYHRFRSANVGIDDVLRRDQNAVMLWHIHPSDADLATITDCLSA